MKNKLIKYPEDLRKIKDRNERLLAALLDGYEEHLNDSDYQHLQRVCQAFKMLTSGTTEIKVKRKLNALGYTNAARILQDVRYLFVDIYKVNPAFERVIQRERIQKHIKKAAKAGEWKAVASLEKTLADVTGTNNHTKESINWNLVNLPALQLTPDISILEDQENNEDFEDIEILDK